MSYVDPKKERLEQIEKIPIDELKERVARNFYGDDLPLAKHVIEEREAEERTEQFNKMLKATQDNAESTKCLVRATWGLVIVTFLLVLLNLLLRG